MSPSANGQLSPLRPLTTFVTGHNASALAIIESEQPNVWTRLPNDAMAFSVPYTTSEFPVDMNNNKDLTKNKEVVASGKLGLVNPDGTVCRIVDFAPGELQNVLMHRTKSLDYGVVLEGEIELILDGGEKRTVGRGDVVVQRGTSHAWRNPSDTEWVRMLFVLSDSKPIEIGGKVLAEDVDHNAGIPPSGN